LLNLSGQFDAKTVGRIWNSMLKQVDSFQPQRLQICASEISYIDGAGIALLLELKACQTKRGPDCEFEIRSLAEEFQSLFEIYTPKVPMDQLVAKPSDGSFIVQFGRAAAGLGKDITGLVVFTGELAQATFRALTHPGEVRWKDALRIAEEVGVNALPIIALIGFLLGFILAFQSAIPMRQFGAEIYVANLVGLSTIRELGGLMTAVILAGRSGSAFAAELGTMKVSEEIDALTTMGLNPIRFLIIPRLIAAVCMMPVLTIFFDLFALIGAGMVMLELGFPLVTYLNQLIGSISYIDLIGGLFKAFVFGILVAGIGCQRGLQTQTGAAAVGVAATRAVVSGIILIAISDGVFAVIFYFLGI